MFGSLRTKLMLSHLGLMLLSMIVLGFYLVDSVNQFYLRAMHARMRDEIVLLSERLGPDLSAGDREAVQRYLAGIESSMAASVLVADVDGVIIGATERDESHLVGRPGLSRGLTKALRSRVEQVVPGVDKPTEDVVTSIAPVEWEGRQVGAIRVAYRLGALNNQIARLTDVILIGLAVAAGVGIVVSMVLAQSLSAPARRLAAAARALGAGDLSFRVKPSGRDEIREAGRSFDALADRLQQMERERQQLLGDISHDLHSSITGVAMGVEALQRGAIHDPQMRPLLLDGLASHSRRLHRLADDLLEAARIEGGRLSLRVAAVPPAALLKSVAAEFAGEAAGRGVALAVRTSGGELPDLWADGERLAQALGNLVENALRHSPNGGSVEVGCEARGGECRLYVHDDGPGIPPHELPKLFDRFHRYAEERPGRLGFGLSIAKGLAEAHEGRVEVESTPGEGSTFTLVIPWGAPPSSAES